MRWVVPDGKWNDATLIELFAARLGDGHKATGFTRHTSGGIELPQPSWLRIVTYPEDTAGIYLLYLDERLQELTDTYHGSIRDAMEQARLEFGVEESDWIKIGSTPEVARFAERSPARRESKAYLGAIGSQTVVDLYLAAVGPKALHVMQVLLESLPTLGLLGARQIVENAPCDICTGLPNDLATQIQARLASIGALAEIRPISATPN